MNKERSLDKDKSHPVWPRSGNPKENLKRTKVEGEKPEKRKTNLPEEGTLSRGPNDQDSTIPGIPSRILTCGMHPIRGITSSQSLPTLLNA